MLLACNDKSMGPGDRQDLSAKGDSSDTEDPSDTIESEDTHETGDSQDTVDSGETEDTEKLPGPCPAGMLLVQPDHGVEAFCMDTYEAPNVEGELPFVMFNLSQSEAWCEARSKRLCYDDEWQAACEGLEKTSYPYGEEREPGVCNDDETWLTYNQSLLDLWPWSMDFTTVERLDELLQFVSTTGTNGERAADHVEALYQGEEGGQNPGCTNEHGVMDTIGNVEEWTLRRDGGLTDYHGNLKGRYWADTRDCQDNITSHGDGFRFYEIGFRCCVVPL